MSDNEEMMLHTYLKKWMPEPIAGVPHSDPNIQAMIIISIVTGRIKLSQMNPKKVPEIKRFLLDHKENIEMLLGKPMTIVE